MDGNPANKNPRKVITKEILSGFENQTGLGAV